MKRRKFIHAAVLASSALALKPSMLLAQSPQEFQLPPLPYAYDALEPHIDARTMEIHHSKHHAAYVKNLNDAIKGTNLEQLNLEQILAKITHKDAKIRNNAGGHYNHSFFWNLLNPNNFSSSPTGKLAEALQQKFGSIDKFKEAFTEKAKSLFGSGWTWLLYNKKKGLFIENTPNQDNFAMKNLYKGTASPVIGLDVWEHAYYLKYQNRRPEYIQAFWNVLNWQEANKNYEKALK
ncbi:MAG: superoxide dismutase [Raineya sp.]